MSDAMPPNNRLTPAERYRRDAEFRTVVDMLQAALSRSQYTPTELREAVILACSIHEARRLPPQYLLPPEEWR
jgi:hypothetical protein